MIEIRTTDTGIGIEPDKLSKIFNAFEQGQSSITRRFGGLGLGLAISKAMVQAHGGTIKAESGGEKKRGPFFFGGAAGGGAPPHKTAPPPKETAAAAPAWGAPP